MSRFPELHEFFCGARADDAGKFFLTIQAPQRLSETIPALFVDWEVLFP
jgi:hypothetical protein